MLTKREPGALGRFEGFDRMFEEWMKAFPFRGRGLWGRDWAGGEMIRVDEYQDNGTLVVRAELPGVDPAKDVEVTVEDGMLTITAERREEDKKEEKGYVRQELRYGSFSRTLTLPEGVSEADIKASYKDGILEIRVPAPAPVESPAKKIPIDKS
jgi:HSP20 family protein